MIQCTRKFVFILCVVTVLLAEELNALPSNNERVKRSRFVVDTTDFFCEVHMVKPPIMDPPRKGHCFINLDLYSGQFMGPKNSVQSPYS